MKKSLVAALPAGVALICAFAASQSSTRLASYNAADAAARSVSPNVVAVQLAATKPDLSSPEKATRSFIAAANANRFEEAALCVDGASPNADFTPLRELMKQERPNISLAMFSSSINGDRAVLKAKVSVKSGKSQQSQTGTIALVRRGARWLMVPADLKAP